ncbi:MAG: type 1 glutamine amidotransferase [Candidatus Omnitrophota bacterium]|nr:type 1 glutamine amidotransferase [Candidatus Omnitrophota bacterium]
MSKVLVVQHTAPETLGTIVDALEPKGVSVEYIHAFQDEPVPKMMDDAAGLIVMGGPMGVRDQGKFPYLRDEMRLIEQALKENKPVLGVCLGSQLLASILGSRVTAAKKEIGWQTVRLSPHAQQDPLWAGTPASFMAFHWHGDIFDLPAGAISLASSDATQHQAFRHGTKAYGMLFHLEMTENMIREMIRTFSEELLEQNLDSGWMIQKGLEYLPVLEKIGGTVFGRWADLL